MRIIKNAEIAKLVWEKFVKVEDNKRIKKYFHLRPTNSGVTIVSTLSGYEMRGILKNSVDSLKNALERISDKYDVLVSIDDTKREKIMEEDLKFKRSDRRNNQTGVSLEEVVQATMINTMSDDHNLSKVLNADKIEFIASEVIFEKGKHRVDIVGFDRNSNVLYLFELKKGRTFKVEQVADYINYYAGKRERGILEKLLRTYPIHSVDKFERMQGVMVMKYAENSFHQFKWKDCKEKNKIEILFYKQSLSYIKYP